LNYKYPKQTCSLLLLWLSDFLEFPSVKSSKILTAHSTLQERILNTKKAGFEQAVFSSLQIWLLPLWKNCSYRFPCRTSSSSSKIFTTSLPNFTEFQPREHKKTHCQLYFLSSCWRHIISKSTVIFLPAHADYLSFHPQRMWLQNYREPP